MELRDTAHAAVQGLPREPIVMFERGPAFETKAGFRGTVLAAYPRDRNPLESGYLLHPERIQGKSAALEVFYGEGRVYLIGFRPQWRGQSHGHLQILLQCDLRFARIGQATAPQRAPAATAGNPQQESWRAVAAKVRTRSGGDAGAESRASSRRRGRPR